MKRSLALAAAAAFALAGCATPRDTAEEAYRAGQYDVAARQFEQRAQAGETEAMAKLALLYLQGYGVTKDPPMAVYWLEQAAMHGHIASMYNLGAMYDFGKVVDPDAALAEHWYRQAAERGDAAAQYNLGAMFANRRIAPDDDVQGLMWLLVAQERVQPSVPSYNLVRFDRAHNVALISSRMNPGQVAEAGKRAKKWRPVK